MLDPELTRALVEGGEGPSAPVTLALAVGLAVVHLGAGRLTALDRVPRSRWLSAAGGVSVAYVFVHVLPEVAASATTIERHGSALVFFEHHVYLVALLGFVTFYGLERLAKRSPTDQNDGGDRREATAGDPGSPGGAPDAHPTGVFWIHVGSFAVYNAIIGWFLLEQADLRSLALFVVAMGLHFVVNDHGLRDHYEHRYDRYGRWVLGAAVVGGVAVGVLVEGGHVLVATLFSFIAGGVILNVIKEELPEERESRFPAFALGAVGYTVILVAV